MPQRSRYPLPDNALPKDAICVLLRIPFDRGYWEAFRGAMYGLSKPYAWANDSAHTALIVGARMLQVFDEMEIVDCNAFPCKTISGDDFDMSSLCELLRFVDGVWQALCCGEWVTLDGQQGGTIPGPVVQPDGTGRPSAGQSKCYNVVMQANQTWQLPFPVQPGDVVTVSNVSGTWNDGTATWYKGDGTTALFGVSTGGGQHNEVGDPDSTDYHMQLIAFTPSEFFPMTTTPFTIAGTGSQQLSVKANDGTPGDNMGSLSFQICVQNGATPPAASWCYLMDFTLSDYGGLPQSGEGVYALGTGWQDNNSGGFPNSFDVRIPLPAAANLTGAVLTFVTTGPGTGGNADILTNVGEWVRDNSKFDGPGSQVWTVSSPVSGATYVELNGFGDSPFGITWMSLELQGTGTNPFGSSNC